MGNWAEERAVATWKLIISSFIAGVQATCTRATHKEFTSSAEICYWGWRMRQQRIQVESLRLVRNLASFILVLIEVVGVVFVKADILAAPEPGLFRSIIHLRGICIKIETTVCSDSIWFLPIPCQAGKTNKAQSFSWQKYFSRRWQIS